MTEQIMNQKGKVLLNFKCISDQMNNLKKTLNDASNFVSKAVQVNFIKFRKNHFYFYVDQSMLTENIR